MPELTEAVIKKIEDTYDSVREIKVVLKGYDGNDGLCKQVLNLEESHNDLNGKFKLLCGILIGLGILGGGSVGLVNLL